MTIEWQVAELVRKAKRYADAHGIAIATASTRIFNDGKVLDRLINGASITTRRFNAAMTFLNRHPGGGLKHSTHGGDRRGGTRTSHNLIGFFGND
nr:hypothetical protein [Ochrobactrum sp. UNC390CL2Tsu3S39]